MSVEYVIKAERLTKSFYQAGREIGVLAGIDLVVKSSDSVAILGVSVAVRVLYCICLRSSITQIPEGFY